MIIMPEIFFFGTLKQVKETTAQQKKGKTCQLFSLWKLTHYLFLFYEGNKDDFMKEMKRSEIDDDMDEKVRRVKHEELDEDEIRIYRRSEK